MKAGRATQTLIVAMLLLAGLSPAGHAQTADAIFNRGIQAFKSGDYGAAQQAFTELTQRDPSAASFNFLAMAEAGAGNLNLAIKHFQKSIQLGNRSAAVRYNLGLAYLRDHQAPAGIRELQKSLAINPDYLNAQYALGVALLDSGRAQEASAYLDKMREQFPRDPRIWANLVKAQFESGQSKQAIETAQDAIGEIPNNARLAVTLANICVNYRQIQTARNLLEDANELMPEDTEVRLLLAKASLLAGEPVEALAVLKQMPSGAAQSGAAPSGERLLLMGEARALTGNLGPAAVDLSAAMKQSPDNPRYLSAYAWLEQFMGKYEGAIQTLTKAGTLDPKSPFIPYRIGVSHYFLGQFPQAQKSCEGALKLDPQYAAARLLLGMIQLKQKNFPAAQANLQKAVDLDPREPLSRRDLGIAMFQAGKPADGKKQLDQALLFDPKDPVTYFWRAKLLASQGARKAAIDDLNAAVGLDANYSDAYSELAHLYLENGQPKQAAMTLAKQKKIKTPSQTADRDRLLRNLPGATQ